MARRISTAESLIKRNSKHLKTSNADSDLKTSNRDTSLKTSNDDTEILGNRAEKIPKRDKRRIFIEEYVRTLNATQSAIKAGYDPKSARARGSQLLANENIRAEIDKALAQRIDSCKVDTEFILQQLKDIALNTRCPYKDRVKALDLLGTYLNMWSGENKTQPTTFTIKLQEEKPD